MLTFEDCIDCIDLTEEEIEAIATHEHIPTAIAAELGNYLVASPDGIPKIKRMIIDDIEHAKVHEDTQRVLVLKGVLKHFIDTHPQNSPKGQSR